MITVFTMTCRLPFSQKCFSGATSKKRSLTRMSGLRKRDGLTCPASGVGDAASAVDELVKAAECVQTIPNTVAGDSRDHLLAFLHCKQSHIYGLCLLISIYMNGPLFWFDFLWVTGDNTVSSLSYNDLLYQYIRPNGHDKYRQAGDSEAVPPTTHVSTDQVSNKIHCDILYIYMQEFQR